MDNPETSATETKKTKQKHNTICVGHHYAKTNTNNINKRAPPSSWKERRTEHRLYVNNTRITITCSGFT